MPQLAALGAPAVPAMFTPMGAVIYWFKRDLRVSDSPALAYAAALGKPVLPVYVAEPGYWALPDTSARQWEFIAECLQELRGALPLVVRVGDAVEVLAELARAHDAKALVSHEETGNLWTYARDRRVAAWAGAAGIRWRELPQCAVERRMRSRDGWAARRGAFVSGSQVDVPQMQALSLDELGRIPTAQELGLKPDPCPQRQRGGRQAGLSLLGSFLTQRGKGYRKDMSSPVAGERGCSRLSPYLAYGALTIREVSQATAARQSEAKANPGNVDAGFLSGIAPIEKGTRAGWNGSLRSFQSRLAWRRTGPHLARMFTDYEPGIHWPQVQMQSGTTGINTVRIYNPVKQGHDQDPTGAFTRGWLPELAEVPDRFVQEPWLWEGAGRVLGRAYPAPIVDVKRAARRASETVWALRKGGAFRAEAQGIVTRHASRKQDRGMQRDTNWAARDDGQMELDL